MSPRNVIVITSDELRADALGFMGNRVCRTANADALAERGVVFTNHFAVHGKCVPSRISMMTGRYAHTDGFRTINLHLPSDQPNLLGTLKRLGYESAVFGHNHVWEDFWGVDNVKSTGYVDYHSYTRDTFAPMLERAWPVIQRGPRGLNPPPLSRRGFDYGGRIEQPLTGFVDDNRTEQAVHYVKNVRDRSRPFYLHLNISKPHPPYEVEEPFFSMYDRGALDVYPHALPTNAPLPMRAMRRKRTGVDATDEALREIQAVYYGMVAKVDTLLGRVVRAIEDEGLFDDSIVIFTADHGDFAGQYGLVEKWDSSMADCLLHAPLVICAPGLGTGKRVESLSEHVDIPATVLELLGVKSEWGMHGESLVPIVGGERRKGAVFADGGHEREMWSRFDADRDGARPLDGKQATYRDVPESMSRTKMVRTERWKLVVRLVGGNELYDLQRDPWELDNLYPGHGSRRELVEIVSDLQLKLIEWSLRTDTDRPRDPNVGA